MRNAATAAYPPRANELGDDFEISGDGFVRLGRGFGTVPRPSLGVQIRTARAGERIVDAPSFGHRCAVVDRGADERMPEHDARSRQQQLLLLGRSRRVLVEAQAVGGAPDEREIAGRLGGCDQEIRLRRVGKQLHLTEEHRLQTAAERERLRQQIATRTLAGRELGRELDERQRVPGRFGDNARTYAARPSCRTASSRRVGRPRRRAGR